LVKGYRMGVRIWWEGIGTKFNRQRSLERSALVNKVPLGLGGGLNN